MSLDRSLRSANSLAKHRNVLSRAERVAKLSERGNFDMSESDPLHLPKVGNRKVLTGTKAKKKAEGEGEGEAAPGAAAPAVAAPAAPASSNKKK